MTPELEQQLCTDFPATFRSLRRRTLHTIEETIAAGQRGELRTMPLVEAFGIECGDGWYGLLHDLAKSIEPECERTGACASQVKEKYGGLRFHTSGPESREMLAAIDAAEARSETICEISGAHGTLRDHNDWLETRCDPCDDPANRFINRVENIEAIIKYAIRPNTPEEAAIWRQMLARLPKI